MILGIVGFAGSGKDTCGAFLEELGWVRESFAKPVKDAVAAIFGWDRELLEGKTPESRAWREKPDNVWSYHFGRPFSPRDALQKMGTEVGRDVYHPDVWVASLVERIFNDHIQKTKNFVITDVRFPNEIKTINENGGKVIRVKRGPDPLWYDYAAIWNNIKDPDNTLSIPTMLTNIHPSERVWIGNPGISETLENDGTLEELKTKLLQIVQV